MPSRHHHERLARCTQRRRRAKLHEAFVGVADDDGLVFFGDDTAVWGLTPAEARDLAMSLWDAAREAEASAPNRQRRRTEGG